MRYSLSRMLVALSLIAICALVQDVSFAGVSLANATSTYTLQLPSAADTPLFTNAERMCMQRVVYGEARSESFATQVAVAASMVTRSLTPGFPHDICKVALQFDQYKGYRTVIVLHTDTDLTAWDTAAAAVERASVYYAMLPDQYRQAVYFHDNTVKPAWHAQHVLLGRLGNMTFYGKEARA